MSETERPAAFFIADDTALDFLNTVAAPWGTEIEWLGHGEDLLSWLELSGLLDSSIANNFRANTSTEKLDATATQARQLREWFRGIVKHYSTSSLDQPTVSELEPINRLLLQDSYFQQIDNISATDKPTTNPLRLIQHRQWNMPESLLAPIAAAMADLICNIGFSRLKNCEANNCPLWFHDVSKNHTRRWCTMSVCGNREKAAAHRAKKRREKSS